MHAHMRVVGTVERFKRELQALGRRVFQGTVDARREVRAACTHRLDRRVGVVEGLARARELADVDQQLRLVVRSRAEQG